MKELYEFDRSTKKLLLVGVVRQQLDSVTGEPVPLRNATEKKPLREKKGFVQGFVTGDWKYYPASQEYWLEDGSKHKTEDGEELPEGALLEAPIIPPTIKEQTALANTECTRRINAHWNQIGQINASLGVYGEEDTANCAAWISSNRTALVALLAREDLLEIDVTGDQYWPIFEDDSE